MGRTERGKVGVRIRFWSQLPIAKESWSVLRHLVKAQQGIVRIPRWALWSIAFREGSSYEGHDTQTEFAFCGQSRAE